MIKITQEDMDREYDRITLEVEDLKKENNAYRDENKTLKNECFICHRIDDANVEIEKLKQQVGDSIPKWQVKDLVDASLDHPGYTADDMLRHIQWVSKLAKEL